MQVRMPNIDFTVVKPIWAPANPGFGHKYDAASLLLPYLEPFLIKVMRKAEVELDRLGLNSEALDRDIQLFNQQEGQHYQLHKQYNDYLKLHYSGLEVFEAEIKRDFESMLENQSLAYNLAYSVGFETIGPIQTPLWFSTAKKARENADPAVDELWSWHLAEEFEHRNVAFDVYQRLADSLFKQDFSTIRYIKQWRYRMKMFSVQTQHLESFTDRVMQSMIEQDDQAGRFPAAEANARWQQFNQQFQRAALPKVLAIAMPWHHPRHAKAPPESLALLAGYHSKS